MDETAKEILEAALAEAALYTDKLPGSHTPLYRRMDVRQQELFRLVALVDYNFFGRCAEGALVDGAVDIGAMDVVGAGLGDAPPAVERLTRVEIADAGTSAYVALEEVHVVDLQDAEEAALAPRVTHRDNVLRQVAADLDGVLELRIHYSRRPARITGPDSVIELPGAHSELLVVDLSANIVRKSLPLGAERNAALELLAAQETNLLAALEAHVAGFSPFVSRF